MKKLAFFVEGQTEQIFLERLLKEILGAESLSIISKRTQGGTNIPKHEIVRHATFVTKARYHILIYDCGADNRVKSEIIDNIPNLMESGYSSIVGLRDLYPLSLEELPRLEAGVKFLPPALSKKYKNPYIIIIAVREIETWFLAEKSHFRRIDSRLTNNYINKKLGINLDTMDPVSRKHPAKDLNAIYQLVGRSYFKRYGQVHKLVKKLNFDNIIRNIRYDIDSLNKLVTEIEKLK